MDSFTQRMRAFRRMLGADFGKRLPKYDEAEALLDELPPPAEKAPSKAERPKCGARCRAWQRAENGTWRRVETDKRCSAPVVVDRDEEGRVRVRSRCRMHGGASTGARTEEGRARLAEAGRRGAEERWRRYREAKAA